ncbi:MAG: hypothetical protein ACKVHP_15590, partial [Verrucomicrobiales bacterium]
MAIEEIELALSNEDVPTDIKAIIDESDKRIDAFFATGENKRAPKYIPSDPILFYKGLANVTKNDLPLGRVFCEWGSGFGVCTCLAAKLGYESFGLEINPNLAAYSRELAQDLSLNVQILETSYVPEDYESYSGIGGEFLIKNEKVASRDARVVSELTYEGMDHEIAEIDVFFAYPWPMEQEFMQELFDEIAVEGAILICYHRD